MLCAFHNELRDHRMYPDKGVLFKKRLAGMLMAATKHC